MNKRKQLTLKPLWEIPELIYGIHEIRTSECSDEERPAGVAGNPSHMLLGTEEALHREAERSLDFAGSVLGVEREGPWHWQRPFLRSLLRRFFDEGSDAPGWLAIIPFRLPHENRFDGVLVNSEETPERAYPVASQRGLARSMIDLRYGIGAIDAESLLLAYPSRSRKDRPHVLCQGRTRMLSGDDGESHDSLIYFGHGGADRDRIAKAYVPAMESYYDSQLRMLRTASITLAKLSKARSGDVTQLIVTVQPEEGWTAALVSGRRALRTYLRQYPTDRTLMERSVGRSAWIEHTGIYFPSTARTLQFSVQFDRRGQVVRNHPELQIWLRPVPSLGKAANLDANLGTLLGAVDLSAIDSGIRDIALPLGQGAIGENPTGNIGRVRLEYVVANGGERIIPLVIDDLQVLVE